ncbi:MAG TPA: antibiotic biosynthesis monooxygenase [Anaerolineae bacterium]|nr:antibiotic biosynthesis monooxygenase [Anaerolineae bacterium]
MIVVANRIRVTPGFEAEFEQRFAERESLLRDEPGFIRNLVLRPVKSDVYVVMTFWQDLAAFERWTQSESFRQSHARSTPSGMFAAPNVLEIHDVAHMVEA